MIYFISWYLIGLISFYIYAYFHGCIKITDVILSPLVSLLGPIIHLFVFFYILDVYGHKTLWKRKK